MPDHYLISPKAGPSGTLRISPLLAAEFHGQDTIRGRATTTELGDLPIVLKVRERTLDGLKPWLQSFPDGLEYLSFCVEIIHRNPLQLRIKASHEPLLAQQPDAPPLRRPAEGLYIGRQLKDHFNELVSTNEPYVIEESDLLTHAFICGVTGAGKTVLGKAILEETALKGIPTIAIDLKGDISSLALLSSGEDPSEIIPWATPDRGRLPEEVAGELAVKHAANLKAWGLSPSDIAAARQSFGVNIFTPRSNDAFAWHSRLFRNLPKTSMRCGTWILTLTIR